MNIESVVAGLAKGMCTPSLSSTHPCALVRRRLISSLSFGEIGFRLLLHKFIYLILNVIDVTHLYTKFQQRISWLSHR